jgi:hypothetical protein
VLGFEFDETSAAGTEHLFGVSERDRLARGRVEAVTLVEVVGRRQHAGFGDHPSNLSRLLRHADDAVFGTPAPARILERARRVEHRRGLDAFARQQGRRLERPIVGVARLL